MEKDNLQELFESSKELWLERHVQNELHKIGDDMYMEYSLSNYKPLYDENTGEYVIPLTYDDCLYFCAILDNYAINKMEIEDLGMAPNSIVQVTDIQWEDVQTSVMFTVEHRSPDFDGECMNMPFTEEDEENEDEENYEI